MATYYVDPLSGSDGNAGMSFGTAWATTQKAVDTAVAGDEVRLCNTATETITSRIDFDTNGGNGSSGAIYFVGYNSDGTSELTGTDRYTIQATSSMTSVLDLGYSVADNIHIDGVCIDANGNATYGIDCNAGNVASGTVLSRSEVKNATSHGIYIRAYINFERCEIHNNGGSGIYPTSVANSRWGISPRVTACKIYDNTSHGVGNFGAQGVVITNSLIYGNGGNGIDGSPMTSSGSARCCYMNNTVYGNTGHGISIENNAYSSGSANHVQGVMNNTSSGNGGYGFYFGDTDPFRVPGMDYNHTHGNTSGATDRTDGLFGSANVTGDPLFSDAASDDFQPSAGSPLILAGVHGANIGAMAHAESSGGGSSGPRIY